MKSSTCLLFLATIVMAMITSSVGEMADVVAESGANATFTCDFDFDDVDEPFDYEVVWEADGEDGTQPSVRLAKFTNKNGGESLKYDNKLTSTRTLITDGNKLTIVNAKLSDNDLMHKIKCVVETGTQSQNHEAMYTVLLFTTTSAAQLNKPDGVYGISNDKSRIIGECTSGYGYPQPVVEFFKDGILIEKPNKTISDAEGFFGFESDGYDMEGESGTVNVQRDLFMVLSEDDDKANISCKVTTSFGDLTKSVEVPMGTIRITHLVSKVTITADKEGPYTDGQKVAFHCAHNGYPESYVKEFGVGEITSRQADIEVEMTADMDGSSVMCSAATQAQTDAAETSLPLVVHYNNNVQVSGTGQAKIGSSVTLECTSNSKPNSTYLWKKNGNKVESGATYDIPMVDFKSAGSYVCVSTNYDDASSAAHQLNVNGIKLKSAVEEAVSTEDIDDAGLSMTCSAESSSKPTFTWMKNVEGKTQDVEWSETLVRTSADSERIYSETVQIKDVNSAYSLMVFSCKVTLGENSHISTFQIGEIKESGGPAGIIVAILVILLIIVIIIGVLYYKGIICKKDGKSGDETADDIEVEIRKDGDIERGAIEGEKLLENGDN